MCRRIARIEAVVVLAIGLASGGRAARAGDVVLNFDDVPAGTLTVSSP
jgi:hypothetical protein